MRRCARGGWTSAAALTRADSFLGPAAARFAEQFPRVSVRLHSGNWDDLVQQLRSRTLDFFVAETSLLDARAGPRRGADARAAPRVFLCPCRPSPGAQRRAGRRGRRAGLALRRAVAHSAPGARSAAGGAPRRFVAIVDSATLSRHRVQRPGAGRSASSLPRMPCRPRSCPASPKNSTAGASCCWPRSRGCTCTTASSACGTARGHRRPDTLRDFVLEAESDATELERRLQRDHAPEGQSDGSRNQPDAAHSRYCGGV